MRANIPSARETINRLSADGLAASIVTVGELYDGAIGSADSATALRSQREFLATFPILSLDDTTMETFARNRVSLRRQVLLIPDLDLLIAATALSYNLILERLARKVSGM